MIGIPITTYIIIITDAGAGLFAFLHLRQFRIITTALAHHSIHRMLNNKKWSQSDTLVEKSLFHTVPYPQHTHLSYIAWVTQPENLLAHSRTSPHSFHPELNNKVKTKVARSKPYYKHFCLHNKMLNNNIKTQHQSFLYVRYIQNIMHDTLNSAHLILILIFTSHIPYYLPATDLPCLPARIM